MEKIFIVIMASLVLIAIELGLIVGFLIVKIDEKIKDEQVKNLIIFYDMEGEFAKETYI